MKHRTRSIKKAETKSIVQISHRFMFFFFFYPDAVWCRSQDHQSIVSHRQINTHIYPCLQENGQWFTHPQRHRRSTAPEFLEWAYWPILFTVLLFMASRTHTLAQTHINERCAFLYSAERGGISFKISSVCALVCVCVCVQNIKHFLMHNPEI